MVDCVHGWHPDSHQRQPRVSWSMHAQNAQQAKRTSPLPQTRKVHLQSEENRVSWSNPRRWNHTNGSSKGQRCSGLATPTEHYGYTFLLGIHGILLLLHTQLFTHCSTYDPADVKEHPIYLGSILYLCIWTSQITHVLETYITPTWLHQSLFLGNRCLSLQHGRHTLTGGRTKPENPKTDAMSSCLLLKHLHTNWTKLWHLQVRIFRSLKSPQALQATRCSYGNSGYYTHWPH